MHRHAPALKLGLGISVRSALALMPDRRPTYVRSTPKVGRPCARYRQEAGAPVRGSACQDQLVRVGYGGVSTSYNQNGRERRLFPLPPLPSMESTWSMCLYRLLRCAALTWGSPLRAASTSAGGRPSM